MAIDTPITDDVELNDRPMDTEEFHITVERTQIRSGDLIAAAYLVLTRDDIRPGQAAEMVLSGHPDVLEYLASQSGFFTDNLGIDVAGLVLPTAATMNDNQLRSFNTEVSRTCTTIRNRWQELVALGNYVYKPVLLTENEWRILEIVRHRHLQTIRDTVPARKNRSDKK